MRIRSFSQKVGFSADWLRRLERNGRIPPATRDLNGHRRYTEGDVEKLRALLICHADGPVAKAQRHS